MKDAIFDHIVVLDPGQSPLAVKQSWQTAYKTLIPREIEGDVLVDVPVCELETAAGKEEARFALDPFIITASNPDTATGNFQAAILQLGRLTRKKLKNPAEIWLFLGEGPTPEAGPRGTVWTLNLAVGAVTIEDPREELVSKLLDYAATTYIKTASPFGAKIKRRD